MEFTLIRGHPEQDKWHHSTRVVWNFILSSEIPAKTR
jgi:hypothetical protein